MSHPGVAPRTTSVRGNATEPGLPDDALTNPDIVRLTKAEVGDSAIGDGIVFGARPPVPIVGASCTLPGEGGKSALRREDEPITRPVPADLGDDGGGRVRPDAPDTGCARVPVHRGGPLHGQSDPVALAKQPTWQVVQRRLEVTAMMRRAGSAWTGWVRQAMTAAVAVMMLAGADLPPEIQVDRYLVQAEREVREGNHHAALSTLDRAIALYEEHEMGIPSTFWLKYGDVSLQSGRYSEAVEAATRYLRDAGREGQHYEAALRLLDAAEAAVAEERAAKARARAAAEAKATAVEAAVGNMVVIPAGTFRMGCLSNEDCEDDEKPVHEVRVPSFALSKYEVTFAQWNVCIADGVCPRASDCWGWGHQLPVIVSWDDAQAYARWLSTTTGDAYRLPSEAEWEYAARAGTETRYHWGDDVGTGKARCWGCDGEWNRTAPVGSFEPNAFGLHDMHGNVGEWVEDCYMIGGTYDGAPSDGSARVTEYCRFRAIRGGGFVGSPKDIRAAARGAAAPDNTSDYLPGFRVARRLSQ